MTPRLARRALIFTFISLLLVAATFALFQPLGDRTTPTGGGASSESARTVGHLAGNVGGAADYMSRFRSTFLILTEQLCRFGDYPSCAAATPFLDRPENEQTAVLELGMKTLLSSLGGWPSAVGGVLPSPTTRHEDALSEFLVAELGGPRAPFSTILALQLLERLPELAPPGVMREFANDSYVAPTFLRVLALDVLLQVPTEEDVPFLLTQLEDPDTRFARRGLRALAKAPGGPEAISRYLRVHERTLPYHLFRTLPAVLNETGLSRDRVLIDQLLASHNLGVVAGTLEALTSGDVAVTKATAERIARLVLSSDATVRSNAIRALAASGDVGRRILGREIESRHWRAEELVSIINHVEDDRTRAADLALHLIPELEEIDALLLASSIVVSSPARRMSLSDTLRGWLRANPGRESILSASFASSGEPELTQLAALLFP